MSQTTGKTIDTRSQSFSSPIYSIFEVKDIPNVASGSKNFSITLEFRLSDEPNKMDIYRYTNPQMTNEKRMIKIIRKNLPFAFQLNWLHLSSRHVSQDFNVIDFSFSGFLSSILN